MKNNKILKIIVPVVAVIVVVQSLVLISRINKRPSTVKTEELDLTTSSGPTKSMTKKDPVYKIDLLSKTSQLSLNNTGKVEVKMVGNSNRNLDSVNVYVKYDPSAFEVTDLQFGKRLPAPAFSKVSTLRGLVVANFLITDAKGLTVNANEDLSIMTFNIKPKLTGNFEFEISTGSEMKESATMIVENATSSILPFTSNKLNVSVSR